MKTEFERAFARAGWRIELRTTSDGDYVYVVLTAPDGRGLLAGATRNGEAGPAELRDKAFENADADLCGRPRGDGGYWACPGWRSEDGLAAPTPRWAYRDRIPPTPGYGSAEELLLKWELYGPGEVSPARNA